MYSKKLLEEFRKYGAVSCPICKQRIKKDWNIFSANAFCSLKCSQKWIKKLIEKLLSKLNEENK